MLPAAYPPYGSFTDYLKNNTYRNSPKHQYSFYDLNGDGSEELVLGYNGSISQCLTEENGDIVSKMFGRFYLCEGSVIEISYLSEDYFDYEEHYYYTPVSNTAVFSPDWQGTGKKLDGLIRKQNQWYRVTEENFLNVETPISDAEAKAILVQYPRMDLDWRPLTEYPLDGEGYTLGNHLKEKDVRVSDVELLGIYKDFLANEADDFYTHYRILDINGDSVDDLLLSGDGQFFWTVLTYRYGTITTVPVLDFCLCENNILVEKSLDYQEGGIEVESQRFMRCNEFETETLAYIAYNKATASWQSDYYGTPMDEAEVNAILEKYPRIDQGMQLISQLLDE